MNRRRQVTLLACANAGPHLDCSPVLLLLLAKSGVASSCRVRRRSVTLGGFLCFLCLALRLLSPALVSL